MTEKRVIDSRNKDRPALVFPAPHPDCKVPHFKSPVQVEMLDRAISLQIENSGLKYDLRRLEEGGEPPDREMELGLVESVIRYQAEVHVLRERLDLADEAVRRPDRRLAYERAKRVDLEAAIAEEQARIREVFANRRSLFDYHPWGV